MLCLLLLVGCVKKEEEKPVPDNNDKGFSTTTFEAPAPTPEPQPEEKQTNGHAFFEPDHGLYRWYDKDMGVACYSQNLNSIACVKVN
jgi:hypothetical protein